MISMNISVKIYNEAICSEKNLKKKKNPQIISYSLIILVGLYTCCEEGLTSEGCKIVRGMTGGGKEEYFLSGHLIDLLQVLQSVFVGWAVGDSFPLSTETSARFI